MSITVPVPSGSGAHVRQTPLSSGKGGAAARAVSRGTLLDMESREGLPRTYFFHLHQPASVSDSCSDSQHSRTGRAGWAYVSLRASGMLLSTLLISCAPKPVKVRLCLGLLKPGPMGPTRGSLGGAPTDGLRSRAGAALVAVAIVDGSHGDVKFQVWSSFDEIESCSTSPISTLATRTRSHRTVPLRDALALFSPAFNCSSRAESSSC